jgi:hypothetical protein
MENRTTRSRGRLRSAIIEGIEIPRDARDGEQRLRSAIIEGIGIPRDARDIKQSDARDVKQTSTRDVKQRNGMGKKLTS